jgi:hypothetical protein
MNSTDAIDPSPLSKQSVKSVKLSDMSALPDDVPPARKPDGDVPEEKPHQLTRDVIDEALRRHAQTRKPMGGDIVLPMPPVGLPRQPKPARDRKKRRRK